MKWEGPSPLAGRGRKAGLRRGWFCCWGLIEMVEKSVDEGAVKVAVTWMDDHARRLIHDQHIIILVNDIQRNILRDQLHSAPPVRHHETDHIPRTHQQIRLRRLLPHLHITLLYSTLDTMTRSILEMGRHELVDADGHLPRIDIQPEMLEHPLFFVLGDGIKFRIKPISVGIHHLESSAIFSSSMVSQSDTDAPMVRGPPAWLGACLYTTALRESL